MALFGLLRGRPVVVALSIFWILITVWQEYLQFAYDGNSCEWPDHKFKLAIPAENEDALRPQHVLIIADPQIVNHRSYPGRGLFLAWLSRLIVDLNLRKNWWVATSKRPDAVVFLGDMMDGGRYDMSDEEYEAYYRRYKRIFKFDPSIPQYFIPGNHDTGLGFMETFSPHVHTRYTSHFGPKNHQAQIANHTLVFIDAPGFIDEEYKRLGMSRTYENWAPLPDGTLEFMHKFKQSSHAEPVILFTHVPLYRPDGRGCGPLREKGTLRPGVGNGYQNTLGKQSSQKVVDLLDPSLIFSGDDHDYCEHTHRLSSTRSQPGGAPIDIREVTVKSISMAMGIRRPGFQLLSLAPPSLRQSPSDSDPPSSNNTQGNIRTPVVTYADTPCFLPDQLHTYLGIYTPLGALTLLILALSQIFSPMLRSKSTNIKHSVDLSSGHYDRSDDTLGGHTPRGSGGSLRLTPRTRRDGFDADIESVLSITNSFSPSFESEPDAAHQHQRKGWYAHRDTTSMSSSSSIGVTMRVVRWFQRTFMVPGRQPGRRRTMRGIGKLSGFARDVRDVMVWPLATFVVIAWWFS